MTEPLPPDSSSREASMLVLFDTARQALASAVRIDEVQAVRNQAERMKLYARQARDRSLIADAVELQHRAERRLGQMIAEAKASGELSKGGRPKATPETPSQVEGVSEGVFDRATLADAGVTYKLSMKAQDLAAIPESAFEEVIAKAREKIVSGGAVVVNPVRDLSTADKKASRAEREQQLGARQAALPEKRFGVIYADPEWRFEPYSRESGMDRAADNHYPTSSLEAIKARDVGAIAADDAVLFLWATSPMLPQALEVMAAWGFTYKSHIVWRKAQPSSPRSGEDANRLGAPGVQRHHGGLVLGTGYWFRSGHELLLVGTRGNVPAPAMGDQFPSMLDAAPLRHSEKPEAFAELIEAYFPNLPKIELNARKARAGWDRWGFEAPVAPLPSPGADAPPSPASGRGKDEDSKPPETSAVGQFGQSEERHSPQGEQGGADASSTLQAAPPSQVAAADPGEPGDPLAIYRQRVAEAASQGQAGHTKASAEPVLRAAYACDPVVPTKQIAADLRAPLGSVLSWAARLKLTRPERRGGPEGIGQRREDARASA